MVIPFLLKRRKIDDEQQRKDKMERKSNEKKKESQKEREQDRQQEKQTTCSPFLFSSSWSSHRRPSTFLRFPTTEKSDCFYLGFFSRRSFISFLMKTTMMLTRPLLLLLLVWRGRLTEASHLLSVSSAEKDEKLYRHREREIHSMERKNERKKYRDRGAMITNSLFFLVDRRWTCRWDIKTDTIRIDIVAHTDRQIHMYRWYAHTDSNS